MSTTASVPAGKSTEVSRLPSQQSATVINMAVSWRIARITPRLVFDTTLDSGSAIGTNRDLSVIQIVQRSVLAGVPAVQHAFDGDYRKSENQVASSRDQAWSRIGFARGTRAGRFRSVALRKDVKVARTEQS